MTNLIDLETRLMQNREVRAEYGRADADYALIEAMIRVRMEAQLTQSELALKIGTSQPAIARLEGGKVGR